MTRIDEYLQWQHNNLFIAAGMLFIKIWVVPFSTGVKPSTKEIEIQKRVLIKTIDDLETVWLHDSKFLTGNEVTFADLMAISSLEQVIGLKLFQLDALKYPKVTLWMDDVRQYFGPPFKHAHEFVYRYGERSLEAMQAK